MEEKHVHNDNTIPRTTRAKGKNRVIYKDHSLKQQWELVQRQECRSTLAVFESLYT